MTLVLKPGSAQENSKKMQIIEQQRTVTLLQPPAELQITMTVHFCALRTQVRCMTFINKCFSIGEAKCNSLKLLSSGQFNIELYRENFK